MGLSHWRIQLDHIWNGDKINQGSTETSQNLLPTPSIPNIHIHTLPQYLHRSHCTSEAGRSRQDGRRAHDKAASVVAEKNIHTKLPCHCIIFYLHWSNEFPWGGILIDCVPAVSDLQWLCNFHFAASFKFVWSSLSLSMLFVIVVSGWASLMCSPKCVPCLLCLASLSVP